MKKIIGNIYLVIGLLISLSFINPLEASAAGTTYYISDSEGSDSNNGMSEASPWKSLDKISSTTFSAGDSILLKKGDTWTGQTIVLHGNGTATNPITLSAYGEGERPVISPNMVDAICITMENLEGWKISGLELSNAWEGIELRYDNVYDKDYIWIEDMYFHDMDHSYNSNDYEDLTQVERDSYLDWGWNSTAIAIRTSSYKTEQRHHNLPVALTNFTLKDSKFYNCDTSYSGMLPLHPGFMYAWEDYAIIDGFTVENLESTHGGMVQYSFEFMNNGLVKNIKTDDTGFEYFRYGMCSMLVAYAKNVTFDGLEITNAKRHPDMAWDGCGFDFEGATENCKLINSTISGTDAYSVLVTNNMKWENTGTIIANNTFSDWSRFYPGYKTGAIHWYWHEGMHFTGTISDNTYISTDVTMPDYTYGGGQTTYLADILASYTISNNTRHNLIPVSEGKTTTSSTDGGADYSAAKAVDGDLSTYWCASSGGFSQDITVDLGELTDLGFVKIVNQVDEGAQYNRHMNLEELTRYSYKIEASTDNTNWNLLVDKSTKGTAGQYLTDEVTGKYRYVKVTISDCNDGNWAAIKELQIFGYTPSGKNLALGTTVLASSTYNNPVYAPSNIVDGNNDTSDWTSWCSEDNALPAWLTVDFGQSQTFDHVKIYTLNGYEQKSYTLQYWDGLAWQNCLDTITNNTEDIRSHSFDAVTSSKLRIYMTEGNVTQYNFARISEVEVYNDDGAAPPVPEVTTYPQYGYFGYGGSWSARRIEAENFDTGGENVAYCDSETSNLTGEYRTSEGVDIETTSDMDGGYNIAHIYDGEWIEYSTKFNTGKYDLTLRSLGWGSAGSVKLYIDGTLIETFYPSTSGVWEDTVISGVNLSGGNKVLKLEMVGYSNNLKINWLSVTKSELKSWKFETDSDTEGWYVGNDVSGFTASNGYLNGTITGTDPQIYSSDNLGINITDNKTLSFVMNNGTTAERAKVYYTTTTDPNFSEAKSFEVILVTDSAINQVIGKDMKYESEWSGTLKQIRIDPINDGVTYSGTFGLDSFTVYDGNYSYPQ